MLHPMIYKYASAILQNLRSDTSQGIEASSFHHKIGLCLKQSWHDPVTANAQMLQIVNLQLPPHLQLNLTEESLPPKSPIISPKVSQTQDSTPSTDTESPSPQARPKAPEANNTSIAVASLPAPSSVDNDYCSDDDEDFVPDHFSDSENEDDVDFITVSWGPWGLKMLALIRAIQRYVA